MTASSGASIEAEYECHWAASSESRRRPAISRSSLPRDRNPVGLLQPAHQWELSPYWVFEVHSSCRALLKDWRDQHDYLLQKVTPPS